MERVIFVLLFFATLHAYSQVKYGIGSSTTFSANQEIIASSADNAPNLSVGAGFLGLIEFPFGKESRSSVFACLEWSSVRHHFIYSGWGLFSTQANLKAPIMYSHYVPVARNARSFLRIGIAPFYQTGGSISTERPSRGEFIERQLEDGVFFLLVVNAGIRYTSKGNHVFDLSIGLQRGFEESEQITYTSNQGVRSTSISGNGSYFDIKFIWYPPLRK